MIIYIGNKVYFLFSIPYKKKGKYAPKHIMVQFHGNYEMTFVKETYCNEYTIHAYMKAFVLYVNNSLFQYL